jgi:DNA/RNA-binding domain of Phe-tRNA-synthetase-like protein
VTWIDPEVAEEFPELRLHARTVEARSGRSPDELRERLRVLSDRFRGAQAIAMRRQPIPWAYRVFFRHIGLDPDEVRTPVEALALERLKKGAFKSRSVLDDALTIAIMETGVPVWALDADRLEGAPGLRPARRGERMGEGEYASDIPAGKLLIADDAGPIGVLFGALAPGRGVGPETTRMTLLSLQVAGVPDIHVEEALWTVADILDAPCPGAPDRR